MILKKEIHTKVPINIYKELMNYADSGFNKDEKIKAGKRSGVSTAIANLVKTAKNKELTINIITEVKLYDNSIS